MRLRRRFIDPLFAEVDASALVVFRVMFGLIMLVECWRFWSKGWIERHYIEPDFFFKYYGFGWVEPWPGDGMYWHSPTPHTMCFSCAGRGFGGARPGGGAPPRRRGRRGCSACSSR